MLVKRTTVLYCPAVPLARIGSRKAPSAAKPPPPTIPARPRRASIVEAAPARCLQILTAAFVGCRARCHHNRAPPSRCDGSRPQQAGEAAQSARTTPPGLPDSAAGGTRPRPALAFVFAPFTLEDFNGWEIEGSSFFQPFPISHSLKTHLLISSLPGNEGPPEALKHCLRRCVQALLFYGPHAPPNTSFGSGVASKGRDNRRNEVERLARDLPGLGFSPRLGFAAKSRLRDAAFPSQRQSKPIRTGRPGRTARGSKARAARRLARPPGAALFGGTRHGGGMGRRKERPEAQPATVPWPGGFVNQIREAGRVGGLARDLPPERGVQRSAEAKRGRNDQAARPSEVEPLVEGTALLRTTLGDV